MATNDIEIHAVQEVENASNGIKNQDMQSMNNIHCTETTENKSIIENKPIIENKQKDIKSKGNDEKINDKKKNDKKKNNEKNGKKNDKNLESVVAIELASYCKKGFVVPSSEIYGGFSGFYDTLTNGTELKNNIKKLYFKHFVQQRDDMLCQDGTIISNPMVWKASGHVDNFSDPMLTTKDTKTKIRADHFIEDKLNIPTDGLSISQLNDLIKINKLTYNGEEILEINPYNLMFNTNVGANVNSNTTAYLRPETCQSIFTNFKAHYDTGRVKLPFGVAQIGKAFRNEISPRDFLFRLREFEQAEIEYFYNPTTTLDFEKYSEHSSSQNSINSSNSFVSFNFLSSETQLLGNSDMEVMTIDKLVENKKCNTYHAYWIQELYLWLINVIGLNANKLRIREHIKSELSHYSSATFDIDFKYSFGYKEMAGIADRGNYDLKQHEIFSKKSLEVNENGTKILPHVIEPSIGIDRLFMAILINSLEVIKKTSIVNTKEVITEFTILRLCPQLSPCKVGVFPLLNKSGQPEFAKKLYKELSAEFNVFYDHAGSIGKRYARQDELGTPFCITIDHQTITELEKQDQTKNEPTVTIRHRDQDLHNYSNRAPRIPVSSLENIIRDLLRSKISFSDLI